MRKQNNGRKFSPSMSLQEFAENNDLDFEALRKLVQCTGLKAQFSRYEVNFYHVRELNHWLKKNSLRVVAKCQISE